MPSAVELPLVGRRAELSNLTAALRGHCARLIVGPPGAGKTRLIQEALRISREPCVFLRGPVARHALLVELARQLENCDLARIPALEDATSISLKPAVLNALRRAPRCVVIEDLSHADPRMYRFLQELYYVPRACLIVSSTSRDRLGFVRKLLWDPREEIRLRPLSRPQARCLFEAAAEAYGLGPLDLEDFRPKVLAAARGNPGPIISMCRLAAGPEYRAGRYIKFAALRMDALAAHLR